MLQVLPLEKIKERIGQEIGLTDWLLIDQDRINKFADCTGDHQWIHVDIEKAKAGPFGKPIAHGYLTVSLISYFAADCIMLPEGTTAVINYGLDKVRLLSPVLVDSKIRSRVVLSKIEDKGPGRILMYFTHTVEIDGNPKPAMVAEVLNMVMYA